MLEKKIFPQKITPEKLSHILEWSLVWPAIQTCLKNFYAFSKNLCVCLEKKILQHPCLKKKFFSGENSFLY